MIIPARRENISARISDITEANNPTGQSFKRHSSNSFHVPTSRVWHQYGLVTIQARKMASDSQVTAAVDRGVPSEGANLPVWPPSRLWLSDGDLDGEALNLWSCRPHLSEPRDLRRNSCLLCKEQLLIHGLPQVFILCCTTPNLASCHAASADPVPKGNHTSSSNNLTHFLRYPR